MKHRSSVGSMPEACPTPHITTGQKGGSEIDLILEGRFGIIPIEIKYAQPHKKTALKALHTCCEDRQLPLGIIINNDDQVCWYSDKIVGIPLSVYNLTETPLARPHF